MQELDNSKIYKDEGAVNSNMHPGDLQGSPDDSCSQYLCYRIIYYDKLKLLIYCKLLLNNYVIIAKQTNFIFLRDCERLAVLNAKLNKEEDYLVKDG